jgi:integrase
MPKNKTYSITQPGSGYISIKSLVNQGFFCFPDRKPINKSDVMKPRFKNLRIYYGVNNLKAGNITLDKSGNSKLKADPLKEWYVRYDFYHVQSDKYVPITVRRGLNRYKDLKTKLLAAEALLKAVSEELSEGYNPTTQRYESTTQPTQTHNMAFREALLWVLDKKTDISKSTRSTYNTNITYLCDALDICGYATLPANLLTRAHIKEALEKLKTTRPNITGNGLNEYLSNIQSLCNYLIEWEVIENNPCTGIKKYHETVQSFTPPNDQEFATIKKELQNAPLGFMIYCMMIYQTGIRPKELNHLRVSNIDFEGKYIHLDAGLELTKNKKGRTVPITDQTASLLLQYLKGKPTHSYIFSRGFKPGELYCHRNRYSELWKQLIKDKHGIDCDMYSLKHRGADDRANGQDMNSDAIAHLFGHHSNILVRKIYNQKKDRLNEEIRKGTPDF